MPVLTKWKKHSEETLKDSRQRGPREGNVGQFTTLVQAAVPQRLWYGLLIYSRY